MAHGFVGQAGDGGAGHSHEQVRQLKTVTNSKAQAKDGASHTPEHLLFLDALLLAHHDALEHRTSLEAIAISGDIQHFTKIGNFAAAFRMMIWLCLDQ